MSSTANRVIGIFDYKTIYNNWYFSILKSKFKSRNRLSILNRLII